MDPELKGLVDDIISKNFSLFNTEQFQQYIYQMVQENYMKGLDIAELEFSMNFVPRPQSLNFLQKYTFDNMKGMTDELQDKLRKELSQGMLNNESTQEIAARIRDTFKISIERAKMITKTEKFRALNAGHYQGAQESGLNLVKEWSAQPEKDEDNPCPICSEMDGRKVKMDDRFDFSDGESLLLPPKHPHCKCRVLYVQQDIGGK